MKFGDDGDLVQIARTTVSLARAGRLDEAITELDALIGAARNERSGLLALTRKDARRKAARENMAELRERRVASGLCRDCGAELPQGEIGQYIRCEACREFLAAQVRKTCGHGAGD